MKRITADVTHAITHNFEVILPTNQMKIDAFRFGELMAEWFISWLKLDPFKEGRWGPEIIVLWLAACQQLWAMK